jgi:hypothetical protein
MYKVRHEMAPSSLNNMFQKTNEVHEHQTRQAKHDFLPPKPKTSYLKRHLAIEVQWPGIIYQVKLKILKLLIFLKQNSRLSIESTF